MNPENSVYVLQTYRDHEPGWINGIFTSLESAMKEGSGTGGWDFEPGTKDSPPRWSRGSFDGEMIEMFEVKP